MKYGAILIDPPWNFKTYSAKGMGRSAENHYPCMTLAELRDVELPAARDCCLFMWVTDPFLEKGLAMMNAWGFAYKTVAFTWTKRNQDGSPFTGMGYWTRSNPEMCLLGTRGHPKRINKDVRQWVDAYRREHSRKPDDVRRRIERLVDGPYLEMFARSAAPGWDTWGNETTKFAAE